MIVQRCNAAVVFSLLPADRGQKLWDFGEGAAVQKHFEGLSPIG